MKQCLNNVRGDENETFSNYGYDKEKCKLLHSTMKRRIPNSFTETLFSKNESQLMNDELKGEFSNLLFF